MNIRILAFLLIIIAESIISVCGYSQDHHEDDHQYYRNEISIALGIVPVFEEDELAGGIHLHYVRSVGESRRFGVGTGLETILDEHRHYTISVIFQYRVYRGLILGYAPGLMLRKEAEEFNFEFAQHLEAAYEFELGQFHLGPMLEIGLEKSGSHLMAGIHFGFDF